MQMGFPDRWDLFFKEKTAADFQFVLESLSLPTLAIVEVNGTPQSV